VPAPIASNYAQQFVNFSIVHFVFRLIACTYQLTGLPAQRELLAGQRDLILTLPVLIKLYTEWDLHSSNNYTPNPCR
jgi:hypothetical protein